MAVSACRSRSRDSWTSSSACCLVSVGSEIENDCSQFRNVTEIYISPEVLNAGVEAMDECKKRKLGSLDTAIAVYLAMRAVETMALMVEADQTRH